MKASQPNNISSKVRHLRKERRWTQKALSSRLGLSQSRLSQIERGQGSFTAEQFLTILSLFNVPVTFFSTVPSQPTGELQNALARLGAAHLQESQEVLPGDRYQRVEEVLSEVLLNPKSPRYVTALAPVMVDNIEQTNLQLVERALTKAGRKRRLGWLAENILEAVRIELSRGLPKRWSAPYRRTHLTLTALLGQISARSSTRRTGSIDLFDPEILSEKTAAEVEASRSTISRKWNIASSIQLEDFVEALRAARVSN